MKSLPKMAPCRNCRTDEYLSIYKYDSGTQHVECDGCYYLGPGAGSKADAIRLYNERIAKAEREGQALRTILAEALRKTVQ